MEMDNQEIYFRTRAAQSQSNRYWIEAPYNWSVQRKQDPVIGIGEIYLNQCIRSIKYRLTLKLLDTVEETAIEAYTVSLYDYCYMSRGDTFQKFIREFIRNWDEMIATKNIELIAAGLTPYQKFDLFFEQCYEKRGSENLCVLRFDTTETEDPDRWDSVMDPVSQTAIAVIPHITFEMLSEDAKEVLNGNRTITEINIFDGFVRDPDDRIVYEVSRYHTLRLYPLWDRQNVFITSSIASMTENGFLGYTRSEPLHRIKYYKVDNNVKRIWIELWSSRDNSCRSILPPDDMDYLVMEGICRFDKLLK